MKGFSLLLRRWLPVVLWAGLVLYASTSVASGDRTASIFRPILAWFFPHMNMASVPEINFFARKAAHVIQFAIYAMLLWRGLWLNPPLIVRTRSVVACILGTAALLALASEGIQLFSPMRSSLFSDVWLDVLGAAIGTGIILGVRHFMSRFRRAQVA